MDNLLWNTAKQHCNTYAYLRFTIFIMFMNMMNISLCTNNNYLLYNFTRKTWKIWPFCILNMLNVTRCNNMYTTPLDLVPSYLKIKLHNFEPLQTWQNAISITCSIYVTYLHTRVTCGKYNPKKKGNQWVKAKCSYCSY